MMILPLQETAVLIWLIGRSSRDASTGAAAAFFWCEKVRIGTAVVQIFRYRIHTGFKLARATPSVRVR